MFSGLNEQPARNGTTAGAAHSYQTSTLGETNKRIGSKPYEIKPTGDSMPPEAYNPMKAYEAKVIVTLLESNTVVKVRDTMQYCDGELLHTKKGICGTTKLRYTISQFSGVLSDISQSGIVTSKDKIQVPGFIIRAEDLLNRVFILFSVKKADLEAIYSNLCFLQGAGFAKNTKVQQQAKLMSQVFKVRRAEAIYGWMLAFSNQVSKVQVSGLQPANPGQIKPLNLTQTPAEAVQNYQSKPRMTNEEYSEYVIRKNESRDSRMNPYKMDSDSIPIDEYQTKYTNYKDAKSAIKNSELGKEDFESRTHHKEKTNTKHLIDFVEPSNLAQNIGSWSSRKSSKRTISLRQIEVTPERSKSKSPDIPNQGNYQDTEELDTSREGLNAIEAIQCCYIDSVALRKERYSRMMLQLMRSSINGEPAPSTSISLINSKVEFSSRYSIELFVPETIEDLFRNSQFRTDRFTIVLHGLAEIGEPIEIGRNVFVGDEINELFYSLNDEHIAIPLINIHSPDVHAVVVLSCQVSTEDRVEKDEDGIGLLEQYQNNPEYDFFVRNDINPFRYDSAAEEGRGPNTISKTMTFSSAKPARVAKIPDAKAARSDLHHIVSSNKLKTLILDLMCYTNPQDVAKVSCRTEKYYRFSQDARLSSFIPPSSQRSVQKETQLLVKTRSSLLNDILQIRQEEQNLEIFDIKLTVDFLTHWANLERLDDFHKRLCKSLGLHVFGQTIRYRRVEVHKRRVRTMNFLYYCLLEEYYVKVPLQQSLQQSKAESISPFAPNNSLFGKGKHPSSRGNQHDSQAVLQFNPLVSSAFKGLAKDYHVLLVFVNTSCPNLASKMTTDWQSCLLLLLPKILELFASILSTAHFAVILDLLCETVVPGQPASHGLLYLLCVMLKAFDTYLVREQPVVDNPTIQKVPESSSPYIMAYLDLAATENGDFLTVLKQFAAQKEDMIFIDFVSQNKANIERLAAGQKSKISGIFMSIQDAVWTVNELYRAMRIYEDLSANEMVISALKYSTVSNSLAVRLLDMGQQFGLSIDQLSELVICHPPPAAKHIYLRLQSVSHIKLSPESREGKRISSFKTGMTDIERANFKVAFSLFGNPQNRKECDLTSDYKSIVHELRAEGSQSMTLQIELVQIDPFDPYRFPKEFEINSTTLCIDLVRLNQPHTLEVKIRMRADFDNEFIVNFILMVCDESVLDMWRDTRMLESASPLKRTTSETRPLAGLMSNVEQWNTGAILLDEMREAGYISIADLKVNVSSFEHIINKRALESHKQAYEAKEIGQDFNYFSQLELFQDSSIGYMDIVKNLSSMPDVENVKLNVSLQHLNTISSFGLIIRMLAFNKNTELLVHCLTKHFNRDNNGLFAPDLVFTFIKLFEILHIRPHSLEVSDYLRFQLGKDLRPRLVSCICVLSAEAVSVNTPSFWYNARGGINVDSRCKAIDLTVIVNQIIFWLSFKHNCTKLVLGDENCLFVLQDIVMRAGNFNRNLPFTSNYLVYRTEYNSYCQEHTIGFDNNFKSDRASTNNSNGLPMKRSLDTLFDLESFVIDLSPQTSIAVSRLELDRLFQSSELLAYIHDVCKM